MLCYIMLEIQIVGSVFQNPKHMVGNKSKLHCGSSTKKCLRRV